MKRKEQNSKSHKNLQKLSSSIGHFIRYWGFRRIHGAIWTQLYLSNDALSCTDLTKRLGLSKALISPALDELCSYKLIHEAPAPNAKTKVYRASENISEVIQHVLKTREAKMLAQIAKDFADFSQASGEAESFNSKRVEVLGEMIQAANIILNMMIVQKNILDLPNEFEL